MAEDKSILLWPVTELLIFAKGTFEYNSLYFDTNINEFDLWGSNWQVDVDSRNGLGSNWQQVIIRIHGGIVHWFANSLLWAVLKWKEDIKFSV